jgi:outer membrane protein TolC
VLKSIREVQIILFAVPCVLFVVSFTAMCQESTSPSGKVLTLEQAVALALNNNRLIEIAELEVKRSEELVAVERTHLLPVFNFSLLEARLLRTLDFEFKKGSLGTIPGTGPIPPVDTNISTPPRLHTYITGSVAQPLSQLYRIWLSIRLTRVNHEVAQEELRSQRQSITNNVKRVYYELLQTQSALEATEEAIKFYRELDRTVAEYVKKKTAFKYESLDVKTELANKEYEALTLHNSLDTQKEQLNDLMGRDIRTEFSVSPVPEPTVVEVDLAAAQARALEQRPDLKEAQLKIEQAEYGKRIIKSNYIPDISFGVFYISPFNVEVLPKNVVTAGLLVTWDVFDWGRKKHEMAASTRAIEQANKGLGETQEQALIDVNARFRKLKETRELLHVSQLRQEAAREKLRVTMEEYKQNAALLKDVLQAQSSLSESNNQYQQTLLSLWTTRADFEKALGEE